MNSSSTSSHNDAHNGGGYHGSIILEYANDNANDNANGQYEEKPVAYNGPHMIHLDTAIFQNKRHSNLIEISSDSEDTTDSESSGESSGDSGSESSGESSDSGSESSDSGSEIDNDDEARERMDTTVAELIEELVFESVKSEPAPETKMITVDLGAIPESNTPAAKTSSEDQPMDVLAMLYKKATSEEADAAEAVEAVAEAVAAPTESLSASSTTHPALTGMSVTELRYLLKEKNKQYPEKHAEIQKMKKAELIQALQS